MENLRIYELFSTITKYSEYWFDSVSFLYSKVGVSILVYAMIEMTSFLTIRNTHFICHWTTFASWVEKNWYILLLAIFELEGAAHSSIVGRKTLNNLMWKITLLRRTFSENVYPGIISQKRMSVKWIKQISHLMNIFLNVWRQSSKRSLCKDFILFTSRIPFLRNKISRHACTHSFKFFSSYK